MEFKTFLQKKVYMWLLIKELAISNGHTIYIHNIIMLQNINNSRMIVSKLRTCMNLFRITSVSKVQVLILFLKQLFSMKNKLAASKYIYKIKRCFAFLVCLGEKNCPKRQLYLHIDQCRKGWFSSFVFLILCKKF